MDEQRGRGGKRKNAGRKTEQPGLVVRKHTLMIDDMTWKRLLVVGDGNVSLGVRKAAVVAYDKYQNEP